MDSFFVVEYSPQQGAFNVGTLAECVQENCYSILSGYATDYVPIGAAPSYGEADALCTAFRSMMQGG